MDDEKAIDPEVMKEMRGPLESPRTGVIDLEDVLSQVTDELSQLQQPQPVESKPEKPADYAFNFTELEVNIILKGLGELPTKEAFNIVNKILLVFHNQRAVQEAEKNAVV